MAEQRVVARVVMPRVAVLCGWWIANAQGCEGACCTQTRLRWRLLQAVCLPCALGAHSRFRLPPPRRSFKHTDGTRAPCESPACRRELTEAEAKNPKGPLDCFLAHLQQRVVADARVVEHHHVRRVSPRAAIRPCVQLRGVHPMRHGRPAPLQLLCRVVSHTTVHASDALETRHAIRINAAAAWGSVGRLPRARMKITWMMAAALR